MKKSNRLIFLECYLKLFGVEKIELENESKDFVKGIAIFDINDPEEKQEFVWYKSEKDTPSSQLNILIERIRFEKLNVGDKISRKIHELKFSEFNSAAKERLIENLFDIEVKMIDDGEETDSFFVHT